MSNIIQSPTYHLLHIDDKVTLVNAIGADGVVILRSPTADLTPQAPGPEGIDNTAYNLHDVADNTLLRISFRRSEGEIVFNARFANDPWGPEERVNLSGLLGGPNNSVMVLIHPDRYQILIGGRTVHYFNKRTGLTGNVAQVGSSVNQGQSPIFGSPIIVEAYGNLGGVITGLV